MIKTLFYFANTEAEYLENVQNIAPYTIVFCKDTNTIWRDGKRYGGDNTVVRIDEESSSISYAINDSSTEHPTNETDWVAERPAGEQGRYLWTRDITAYTDGTHTITYGVVYFPLDGAGTAIDKNNTFVRYSNQKTLQRPDAESFTLSEPPSLEIGDWLWVLNRVTYEGGTPLDSYSVSRVGSDGAQGDPGSDGYTTHFAYATSSDGKTNFSTTNFNGATYIGTCRDNNENDPTAPESYVWTKWKGDNGQNGVSSYIHIKYSNDAGKTFTANDGETPGYYMGQCVDNNISAPTNVTAYKWALIKGDDGKEGTGINIKGAVENASQLPSSGIVAGDAYMVSADLYIWTGSEWKNIGRIKGEKGDNQYVHIAWSTSANGSENFATVKKSGVAYTYMGMCVDFNSDDPETYESYVWTLVKGDKGDKGDQGEPGPKGEDGLNGKDGVNGAPGTSTYFHVAYANKDTSGSIVDFSLDDPTDREYIGTYVDSTSADSESPAAYTWMFAKGAQGATGEQGIPGQNGADGKTSYLHIKYSNDGKTFTANNGETPGYYLGQYVDFTLADSTVFSQYKWVLIKGTDGTDGKDGTGINIKGAVASASQLPAAGDNPGDAYMVDKDLYVWTGTTWKNVGQIKGDDGKDGTNGMDGKSAYLHIAYATSSNGTNFSTTHFIGATYIGMYTDSLVEDSEDWQDYVWSLIKGDKGDNGTNGYFKSTVFKRTNTDISSQTPTGGDYDHPWPGGVDGSNGWYDSIPSGNETLWSSVRTFKDGDNTTTWSAPRKMTDTASFDVEFSSVANPNNPTGHPNTNTTQWSNTASSSTIWMATSECHNGVWSDWQVMKIKGEGVTMTEHWVRYAAQAQSDYTGVHPATSAFSDNFPSIPDGGYLWTWTHEKYNNNVSNDAYSVSRVGIDGHGVKSSTVDYCEREDTSVAPENITTWGEYPTDLHQGWWLYTRTIITYSNNQTTTSYSCSQIGTGSHYAGVIEYYAVGASSSTAPTGYPTAKTYTAGQTISIGDSWKQGTRPDNDPSTPYLWNFEISSDSDGNRYVTNPVCIGNWSRGIKAIIELYAISAYSAPNASGDYPSDITTWTDEHQDAAPTDEKPYQWNKTIVAYNDSEQDASADGWKDSTCDVYYHVSAVKGQDGKSVTKTGETYAYGVTTDGATAPSSEGSSSDTTAALNKWYSSRSKVNSLWTANRWLWTRTTITWSNNNPATVLYTNERNPINGVGIVADGTVVKYSCKDSNAVDPTSITDWNDYNNVTKTQGWWLWSQATTYYRKSTSSAGAHDGGSSVNYNVSYIANDGSAGRAITEVKEYYKATNSSDAMAKPTSDSGWDTDPNLSSLTNKWGKDYKYLWNYEKITYSSGTTTVERTIPQIVAIWTKDGKGISSITNYYKVTSTANVPDKTASGWDDDPQAPGPGQYLWNYEKITWTDGSADYESDVQLIGYHGINGTSPYFADIDNEMDSVACYNDGKTKAAFDDTIGISLWKGSSALDITTLSYSVNGGTSYSTEQTVGNIKVTPSTANKTIRVRVAAGAAIAQTNEIDITLAGSGSENKTLHYVLNGVRDGDDGDDAIIYSLVPSVSSVLKKKDGSFSVSNVSCTRQKNKGGAITNNTTDGTIVYILDGDGVEHEYTNNTDIAVTRFSKTIQFVFKVNSIIVDKETIPLVSDGNDGLSLESYIETQEAWSNQLTTASQTTMPSDCSDSDWKSNTPQNTNNRAYLWRRSRVMTLKADKSGYTQGSWVYTRLSGTNGTSIEVKGTLASVIAKNGTFPTSGMSANDLGIKQESNAIWKFNGSTWSATSTTASDGDSYVVSKSCIADLDGDGTSENIKGHLVMWSGEASKWIDLGVFLGENGYTYYTHVAWASDITIGTATSDRTDGQTTTPNASACGSFSIAPQIGYDWMGILVDRVASDSTAWKYYTWKYTKGNQGTPGGNTATVYLYKRSSSTISSVGITSKLYYKFGDSTKKYLYTNSTCTTAATTQLNGWSTTIPTNSTDPIYVTAAIAFSTSGIDDIASTEWVTPAQYTDNGTNGINTAAVFLYQRASTKPSGDAAKPTQSLYYKFANGKLYTTSTLQTEASTQLNGWQLQIPDYNGSPCYAIQAAAIASAEYDTITTSDWSDVRMMVQDGVPGNNAVRFDIDNEMDVIPTDSAGKTLTARTVSTVAHLYDGKTEIDISGATITSSRAVTSSSASGKGKQLNWTIAAGTSISDALEITLVYTYNNTAYSAVFTVAASKGQAIWQLQPDLASIPFQRNSDNTLTPASRSVNLKLVKIDGGSTAEYTTKPSDVNVRYSTDDAVGVPAYNAGTAWSSGAITVANSAKYLYIALYNSSNKLLDREVIPVVKDGAKGALDTDTLNTITGRIGDIETDMDGVNTKVGNLATYNANGEPTAVTTYMASAIGNYISGVYADTSYDGAMATLFADTKDSKAFVSAVATGSGSSVKIKADKIDMTGATTFTSGIEGIIGSTEIDGAKIKTGSITATQIAANTITAAKIAANTITADKVNLSSIVGAINDSTGTSKVSIDADHIALTGTVVMNAINGTTGSTSINGGKIDTDTLTAKKLEAKNSTTATNVTTVNGEGVTVKLGTNIGFQANANGSGSAAKGNISWSADGTLSVNGAITATSLSLGQGVTIGGDKITSISGNKITTGTVAAARIDVDNLEVKKLKAANSTTATNVTTVNGDGVTVKQGNAVGFQAKADGSGSAAKGNISWTTNGTLSVNGAITATSLSLGNNASIAASKVTGLSTVATSGKYADLSNKPTIPTKVSDLTDGADYAKTSAIPTKVSQLTNDKSFITNDALSGYATSQSVQNAVANCLTQDDLTGYVQSSDLDGYVETNVGLGDASSGSYFLISNEGLLTANNAIITGQVSATSGAIGGILIGNNNIASTNGNFSVTDGGVLTAKSGTIGGWTIGEKKISSGSGTSHVSLNSGATGTSQYAIWAGNETDSSAPFSVTKTGALKSTSGTIGGWTIGANQLNAGSGTSYIALNSATSGNNSNYAIWAGNSTPASASFSVTKAGVLNATSAKISGEITATKLTISNDATFSGSIPQSVVSGLTSDLSTINGNITSVGDKADIAIADAATAKNTATNAATAASNASTAASNAQTSANSAASVVQTIYHAIANSATTGPSSPGSTWITDATGGNAKWTTLRPAYNADYKRLYVATQKKTVGGTVTTTSPVLDQTTTVIDGGNITTGTIAAARIDTDNLIAKKLAATQGTVGGWTIGENQLNSGSGTSYVALNSAASNTNAYAMWAGNSTAASAPFSVTKAGALKSTSGTIGGFTISSNRFSSTNNSGSIMLEYSNNKMLLHGSGLYIGTGNTAGVISTNTQYLAVDGSGMLASGNIVWNSQGHISQVLVQGEVSCDTLTANYTKSGNVTAGDLTNKIEISGTQLQIKSGNDVVLGLYNDGSAEFSSDVDIKGDLVVTGTISGSFGALSATSVTASGDIAGGSLAIKSGNTTNASITSAGAITAKGLTVYGTSTFRSATSGSTSIGTISNMGVFTSSSEEMTLDGAITSKGSLSSSGLTVKQGNTTTISTTSGGAITAAGKIKGGSLEATGSVYSRNLYVRDANANDVFLAESDGTVLFVGKNTGVSFEDGAYITGSVPLATGGFIAGNAAYAVTKSALYLASGAWYIGYNATTSIDGGMAGALNMKAANSITANKSIQTSSDETLKDIISTVDITVEDIAATRIVNFKYKDSEDGPVYAGAIAQDWKDIVPNAVKKDADDHYMLDYSAVSVVASVTAAREIVALKARIAELESKIK